MNTLEDLSASKLSELLDRLVETERLLPDTAARLSAAVEACGPLVPVGA